MTMSLTFSQFSKKLNQEPIFNILEEHEQILEQNLIEEGFFENVGDWAKNVFNAFSKYSKRSISAGLLRNLVKKTPPEGRINDILKGYKEIYRELRKGKVDLKNLVTLGVDASVGAGIAVGASMAYDPIKDATAGAYNKSVDAYNTVSPTIKQTYEKLKIFLDDQVLARIKATYKWFSENTFYLYVITAYVVLYVLSAIKRRKQRKQFEAYADKIVDYIEQRFN